MKKKTKSIARYKLYVKVNAVKSTSKYKQHIPYGGKWFSYHGNDLLKFTAFLDKNFIWGYFTVYDNRIFKKTGNSVKIAYFTNNDKPKTARL